MADTNELKKLLSARFEKRVYEAIKATFPSDQFAELHEQTFSKFAKALAQYSVDEIDLIQRVIVETIGIDFDLSTYSGEHVPINDEKARGYADSTLYKETLSKSTNVDQSNTRIVGKLDLKIRK